MEQTLGYACINTALKNQGIYTNRGLRAATLKKQGIQQASKLALDNAKDLYTIIDWNNKHNIKFYRISSDIFPWGNKINISTLPDYAEIRAVLASAGKLAQDNNQRLTCHPGPFNLLASPKESVVLGTIADLELHSQMFDLLELSHTPYNKINIHIGATYGDKPTAIKTWITNYKRLSDSCKSRLTVENDDKASMFSMRELYDMIYSQLGVSLVFDYHHHKFCTGGLSEQEALELAISTWGDIKPVVHYSESKALHENDSKIRAQAHSDYLREVVNTYGHEIDIMLECKAKEDALLRYRENIFYV